MRGAAHQHHALDREGEGRHVHLRHIGDEPRAFADRDARERARSDRDLAGLGEDAEQRLEQRGLAAAVGPEQRQHLALRQRHVEPAPDHAVAVADGEVAAGERHLGRARS